jgi:plasmid segregation protein ParM
LKNVEKRRYVYTDPTTWEKEDFTDIIEPELKRFVEVTMKKLLSAFQFSPFDDVYFVHIGGVTELLKPYIQEYLVERLSLEVAQERHIFPQEARKLNLYGCEIVAKDEEIKKEGVLHGSKEQ